MTPDEDALRGRRTPIELSPEEFAEMGHRLVDDVTALLESMRTRPLSPGLDPEEVRERLGAGAGLPDNGTDPVALLRDTTELLVDNSLYNGHPRFFGYITAGAAPMGILADLLASAVNPNTGGWALSPMASEMEDQAVRWIADLVGFPTDGDGVLTSGGNVANMLGFWAARAAKAGWDVRESGMRAPEASSLRVYGSAGTHTWIQKAVDLSGLGAESVRWIETDERGRMKVDALRAAIDADLDAGDRPFLVVGTGGSVATGAVDPLPELRALCDELDLWLHVDGAYGAFAAAAHNAPDDLRALATADSVALDPHKWLYAPLEAGCTLVRDPAALLAAFSYRPDYYHFQQEAKNYFEHGIQNSRGFRALKVWLQLRQVGRSGYARMIAEDIELARRFHEIAEEREELQALGHGLSITTYRYVPADLQGRLERLGDPVARSDGARDPVARSDEDGDPTARGSEPDDRTDDAARRELGEYLDDLNREIQSRMERGGEAFVSNAVLGDVYALRMCIVNFRTTLEDVVALADITERLGREVDDEMRPEELR